MANRRMISKDDAEHARYYRLSIRQRYFFDHLMLYADDDGIMPYDLIKSKIFLIDADVDDESIAEDLDVLEKKGFILQYTCPDGEIYVTVLDWWQRQFIDLKIYKPTLYPTPPQYSPRPEEMKRGPKSSRYTYTGTIREQYKEEKMNSNKNNLEELKKEKDGDLPFEPDGSINPLYK